MLDENFDTYGDENDASEQFDVDTFDFTEAITADNSNQREGESYESNDKGGKINTCFKECHADTHGQSVDAGGYSQGEQGLGGKRRDGGFFFPERFVDHFATQKTEKDKSNPMIEGGNV